MTDETLRHGWRVEISGEAGTPQLDKITLTRHDAPRILIEIDAPGIRSAGVDQKRLGRKAIQDLLHDLQEALDSPSALPGFRPDLG